MNIERVQLQNFKRFTDVTLDLSGIDAPKLVVLIGANGCGKSSVFDAFEHLSGFHKGNQFIKDRLAYLKKDPQTDCNIRVELEAGVVLERKNEEPVELPENWDSGASFYGRSSFRTIPTLSARLAQPTVYETDSDRPKRFIDHDSRFEADIAKMTERILQEVWGENFDAKKMREQFVDPLNDAIDRIFRNGVSLKLTELIPALEGKAPRVMFEKGDSKIHYDLLSSGEKEVFNILLNLFIRREYYQDSIYFIDELDVHLHTSLQYSLIQEIVENWLPENCQLWTATHSLGFIEYASESSDAAILDFDELDFDNVITLHPATKTEQVFDIAVPKNSALKVFPN